MTHFRRGQPVASERGWNGPESRHFTPGNLEQTRGTSSPPSDTAKSLTHGILLLAPLLGSSALVVVRSGARWADVGVELQIFCLDGTDVLGADLNSIREQLGNLRRELKYSVLF